MHCTRRLKLTIARAFAGEAQLQQQAGIEVAMEAAAGGGGNGGGGGGGVVLPMMPACDDMVGICSSPAPPAAATSSAAAYFLCATTTSTATAPLAVVPSPPAPTIPTRSVHVQSCVSFRTY